MCYNDNGDDMQNKLNKIIWIIVAILFFSFIGYVLVNERKKEQAYEKKIYYMDTYIYIKLYTENEKQALDAFEGVNRLYKKYHELSDRYHGYPGLKNIYYIHHNEEKSEYLTIDERLYDMIELSLLWTEKSDGLFDIRIGNLIDTWREYKEEEKLPSSEVLNQVSTDEVILKDGKILNNHPNLDLGGVAKGYATKEVGKYLESIGIDKYIINAGGNVLVGKHYDSDAYKIGIEDPTSKDAGIFMKVKAEKKAVVTSGGYERFYEIDGKKYHHILNPKTKYPADQVLSVTVITSDSALADILSTLLFVMDLEDGLSLVNSMDDVEAVFYVSEDEQILSDGFGKYLYE